VRRKLIYSMGVSLDGFIAGPDGEIDWSAPDEEPHRFHNRQMREVGVHLCGRGLYTDMTYWETAEENPSATEYELEFARIWRDTPKLVFSKSLEMVTGNARLATDSVAHEVGRLKEQPGKVWPSAAPAWPAPAWSWASSTSTGSSSARSS
jgi:dihydrofolate reductase